MIDASRHDHQITLLQPYAHPVIIFAAHIEVSTTAQDISDLLVLMKVLVEEVLHLLFISWESRWADLDLISILVVALLGDAIHRVEVIWELVVLDSEV